MWTTINPLRGQEFIVQSNNAPDLKQYEQVIKSEKFIALVNKLKTIVKNNEDYSNTNIIIQITLFDPTMLGSLKLKNRHIHSLDYVDIWKTTYINEDRIMFFFEKQGNQYIFKDFVVTQNIEDGQIPELVRNYISEQILRKENNNITAIVYKGINAVKNAYDRRFQQKLIEHAPKMLMCRYYYKGYTSITTYSYYFRNATINRNAEFRLPLVYLHQGVYHAVYLNNWNITRANAFDNLIGHALLSVNNIIPHANLLYTQDGTIYKNISILNLNFEPKDLFDYTRTGHSTFESVAQQAEFNFVEKLKNSKNILTMDLSNKKQLTSVQQDGLTVPVSHNTLYKLTKDTIHGPTASNLYNAEDNAQADSISVAQLWGHPFWSGYPTWCNVYAQYLSRHIYGQVNGDYLVPSQGGTMNANKLFDYFSNSPHYIVLDKISDNDIKKIWEYVNKGYPVYFSRKNPNGSGHIETGVPPIFTVVYNKQGFFDEKNTTNLLKTGDNKFLIGAGSTVGFKSYEGYSWSKKEETKAFIALGYLSKEYE
jgi:hypothetical protein